MDIINFIIQYTKKRRSLLKIKFFQTFFDTQLKNQLPHHNLTDQMAAHYSLDIYHSPIGSTVQPDFYASCRIFAIPSGLPLLAEATRLQNPLLQMNPFDKGYDWHTKKDQGKPSIEKIHH